MVQLHMGLVAAATYITVACVLHRAEAQKRLRLAAAAAILRGGPMIPLPLRYPVHVARPKIIEMPIHHQVPIEVPVQHYSHSMKRVSIPVHGHSHSEKHVALYSRSHPHLRSDKDVHVPIYHHHESHSHYPTYHEQQHHHQNHGDDSRGYEGDSCEEEHGRHGHAGHEDGHTAAANERHGWRSEAHGSGHRGNVATADKGYSESGSSGSAEDLGWRIFTMADGKNRSM
ncbi:polyadenylate-binding protein 1-B-like [Varroa destructor]|uniref:Uncharacterized protein n=1 Tax=Varroa destructor TaxID=109461 RepID=A0A7M7JT25_VARDE|nr:polyadenylate-binding protein 1-B-like [Varroa destructor]